MESFSTARYRNGEYADTNTSAGLLQKFCSAWLQGQEEDRVGENFFARYRDKKREWAIAFTFAEKQFQGVRVEVTETNVGQSEKKICEQVFSTSK